MKYFLILFFPFALFANCSVNQDYDWSLDLKPGYYYFTDSTMREIFGSGAFLMRYQIDRKLKGPYSLWMDGGFFSKHGQALGTAGTGEGRVSLSIANVTLGLKGTWFLAPKFAFYGGIGARYFMVWQHNSSRWVDQYMNQKSLGGAFTGGFLLFPFTGYKFFIDLFIDYSLKTLCYKPSEVASITYNIDISGLNAGAGLGWRF